MSREDMEKEGAPENGLEFGQKVLITNEANAGFRDQDSLPSCLTHPKVSDKPMTRCLRNDQFLVQFVMLVSACARTGGVVSALCRRADMGSHISAALQLQAPLQTGPANQPPLTLPPSGCPRAPSPMPTTLHDISLHGFQPPSPCLLLPSYSYVCLPPLGISTAQPPTTCAPAFLFL